MLVFSLGAPVSGDTLNAKFRPVLGNPEATDFTLEDRFGEIRQLSEHQGRVVIINFWATWCAPCLAELPTMQALWKSLSGEPFELLAINVGEERLAIDQFLSGFDPPLDFHILVDPKMRVAREWQVRGVPTTYIVDRHGHLTEFAEGGVDFTSGLVTEKIHQLMY